MTADPNEIQPKPPEREPSQFARFVGSFVVDGIVQLGMTWWFKWILASLAGITFHFWLFWLASVIFYMTMHWHDALTSGRIIVWHILLFILLTIYIWIF